jgi:hypothetical protein
MSGIRFGQGTESQRRRTFKLLATFGSAPPLSAAEFDEAFLTVSEKIVRTRCT